MPTLPFENQGFYRSLFFLGAALLFSTVIGLNEVVSQQIAENQWYVEQKLACPKSAECSLIEKAHSRNSKELTILLVATLIPFAIGIFLCLVGLAHGLHTQAPIEREINAIKLHKAKALRAKLEGTN